MRTALTATLLTAIVCASVVVTSPAEAGPACARAAVKAGIERFIRAQNQGDASHLRDALAPTNFRVYSAGLDYGPEAERFFSTKDRAKVVAHLVRRHERGDRVRLREFTLNDHDPAFEICNVGFVLRRKIASGPWRPFNGKGALDQPSGRISVWNVGGQRGAD